jgi:hypothetical protein
LAGSPDNDFSLSLTPYAWFAGLQGKVGVEGVSAKANSKLADPSDYLLVSMLRLDALYQGRAGLLADVDYSFLDNQSTKQQFSLNTNIRLILSDVAFYYRFLAAGPGELTPGPLSLDLLAGARIWSLALGNGLTPLIVGSKVTQEKGWTDPILGLRAKIGLAKRWDLELRGVLGGFGASSALTWEAMATVDYAFWEHGSLLLGYRAVGINHTEGGAGDKFTLDMTLQGPIAGLAFTF